VIALFDILLVSNMKTKDKIARTKIPEGYDIPCIHYFLTPTKKPIAFPESLQKINGNPKLLRQKQIAYVWQFKDEIES